MIKCRLILLLLMSTFLVGCGQPNIPLPDEFWESPSKTIGIGIATTPDGGGYFKIGAQGLLDLAINEAAASSEIKHLRSMRADNFKAIINVFQEELERQGFSVIVCPNDIVLANIPKCSEKGTYTYDLKNHVQSSNCDYFILLQLKSYGAARDYYGFIPLSAPRGAAHVHGAMVDIHNRTIWHYNSPGLMDGTPVDGKWNQPPDYPNLSHAVNKAIEKAEYLLTVNFFDERLSAQVKETLAPSDTSPQ